MYTTILAAIDLSPTSEPALRTAIGRAREGHARLVVLHVNALPHEGGGGSMPPSDAEPNQEALQDLFLATVKRHNGGARLPSMAIARGPVAETILRLAGEQNADLIVVGTNGKLGDLGAVADRIVRTAGRPVLVVHSAAE